MARNSQNELSRIYREFTRGSTGFCREVETWCGYNISINEITRIAARAATAEEFAAIWENSEWWTDAANDSAA